jgi:hypothetical protein
MQRCRYKHQVSLIGVVWAVSSCLSAVVYVLVAVAVIPQPPTCKQLCALSVKCVATRRWCTSAPKHVGVYVK